MGNGPGSGRGGMTGEGGAWAGAGRARDGATGATGAVGATRAGVDGASAVTTGTAGRAAGAGATGSGVLTGIAGARAISAAIPALPMLRCKPMLICARATMSGAVADMPTRLPARATGGRPLAAGRIPAPDRAGAARKGAAARSRRGGGAATRGRMETSCASSFVGMFNPWVPAPVCRLEPSRSTPRRTRPG